MAGSFKPINIRFPSGLLELIDQAASEAGQDRSNWIRAACSEKLSGAVASVPHPSMDKELLQDLKVADPRAREVIKDVIARVERLEQAVFPQESGSDPFGE